MLDWIGYDNRGVEMIQQAIPRLEPNPADTAMSRDVDSTTLNDLPDNALRCLGIDPDVGLVYLVA